MYVHVKVTTNVRKESFDALSGDHFSASVREKAERNAANKRVLALVAEYFGVTQNKVHIVNGHQSPSKLIEVHTK